MKRWGTVEMFPYLEHRQTLARHLIVFAGAIVARMPNAVWYIGGNTPYSALRRISVTITNW